MKKIKNNEVDTKNVHIPFNLDSFQKLMDVMCFMKAIASQPKSFLGVFTS